MKPTYYILIFIAFTGSLVGMTFWRANVVNGAREAENERYQAEGHQIKVSKELPPVYLNRVDLGDTTERMLAVLECAGCHPKAYAGWKDGPHAAAYAGLMDGFDDFQHSGHYPEAYPEFVKGNMDMCLSCHVTQNLFETVYKGVEYEEDPGNMGPEVYPELFKMGEHRKDSKTWSTGVDCFTCHYNGERVVTGPDFKPPSNAQDISGYCDPIASPFFALNTNCNACHGIQVGHTFRLLGAGKKTEWSTRESNCVTCHQEYDAEGNGTHYMFWRHGDKEKHPRIPVKGGIFDALHTKISSHTQPRLIIDWENDLYPHGFSECGEIVVKIEVLDRQEKLLLATEVRLNRREHHSPGLSEAMGVPAPGINGYTFNPTQQPLHLEVPLDTDYAGTGTIRLVGIDKLQYWASDDIIGDTLWTETRYF